MSNPLDRLEDGFPHGTIDGERAGCVGRDCPARPLRCGDIGGRYRTDLAFRRNYKLGYRGQDLLDACDQGPGEAEIVKQLAQRSSTPASTRSPNHPAGTALRSDLRLERLWVIVDDEQHMLQGFRDEEAAQAELERRSKP